MHLPSYDKSKAIYFYGTVVYDGRAYSELGPGNFLLLYKADRSLSIHGSTLIIPRNYLNNVKTIDQNGSITKFSNKKESITVDFMTVHDFVNLQDLSDSQVVLQRTEKELIDKLSNNWERYFGFAVASIHTEFPTDLGPVDLVGIDDTKSYHIVEAKRKKVSLNHVSQLLRYMGHFHDSGITCAGYVAAPAIGDKAHKYLTRNGCKFVEVNFDSTASILLQE